MRSKHQRVYLPKFCERCGREEFEGFVFGQWRATYLHAQHGNRTILCDHCMQSPAATKARVEELLSHLFD